jgi:hypothetical protein
VPFNILYLLPENCLSSSVRTISDVEKGQFSISVKFLIFNNYKLIANEITCINSRKADFIAEWG